jgi:hypothetical protein
MVVLRETRRPSAAPITDAVDGTAVPALSTATGVGRGLLQRFPYLLLPSRCSPQPRRESRPRYRAVWKFGPILPGRLTPSWLSKRQKRS